ncbi:bifunctional demethylmenaquinone methyltransferase/2-methoxy-6-polyprenyl-1,4-benzoquinol methylase UbiE [Thermogutta sp.]|uniref:bifunctional demethylmenaquinone methyltransferase/2-methoxy-6-polyprenyl-1,4-benzoquinol methylase UbiE n=1 Tax=Thermogutta sp. TaxID=1962930 RepID=UPI0032208B54
MTEISIEVRDRPWAKVDKQADRIREMFAEISPRYDFLNHFLSCGQDILWRRKVARLLKNLGQGPALDVCCGTGDLVLEFFRVVQHRVPLVGIDFCRPMLRLAQKKAQKKSAKIWFIEGDGLNLPFPDDQFAVVAVAFGLRNMADLQRGLGEMYRVCRAGGEIAILEFTLPRAPVFGKLYRFYFQHILPRVGQWVAPNRHEAYGYLPASVLEFPQGNSLLREMERVGLRHLWHRSFTFGVATLYVGTK